MYSRAIDLIFKDAKNQIKSLKDIIETKQYRYYKKHIKDKKLLKILRYEYSPKIDILRIPHFSNKLNSIKYYLNTFTPVERSNLDLLFGNFIF